MYAPQIFDGIKPEGKVLLAHFRRYTNCCNMPEDEQLAFFPCFEGERN